MMYNVSVRWFFGRPVCQRTGIRGDVLQKRRCQTSQHQWADAQCARNSEWESRL